MDEIVFLSECKHVGVVTSMNDVFVWNVHTSKFWKLMWTHNLFSLIKLENAKLLSWAGSQVTRITFMASAPMTHAIWGDWDFWVYFLIFYCRHMLNQTLKRGMYWSWPCRQMKSYTNKGLRQKQESSEHMVTHRNKYPKRLYRVIRRIWNRHLVVRRQSRSCFVR